MRPFLVSVPFLLPNVVHLARLREIAGSHSIDVDTAGHLSFPVILSVPHHRMGALGVFPVRQDSHFLAQHIVDFDADLFVMGNIEINGGGGIEGIGIVLRQSEL